MASTSTRKLAKDAAMVGGALLAVWLGLMIVFGTPNPFYVVASGSMVPTLEVHDLLVISAHEDFGGVIPGDVIVFNRPSDNDRVIVHRVAAILDEDPRTIRTKGDANPASIPGTDFPITEQNYPGHGGPRAAAGGAAAQADTAPRKLHHHSRDSRVHTGKALPRQKAAGRPAGPVGCRPTRRVS